MFAQHVCISGRLPAVYVACIVRSSRRGCICRVRLRPYCCGGSNRYTVADPHADAPEPRQSATLILQLILPSPCPPPARARERANLAVSLHPQQLQALSYELVRKDFFVERTLGGAVGLEPALTYRIQPAEVYLTERKTPGFLKDYNFRAGSVEAVFRVKGPAGGAAVLCAATKEMGLWKMQALVVEFESADVPADKCVTPSLLFRARRGKRDAQPPNTMSPRPRREP